MELGIKVLPSKCVSWGDDTWFSSATEQTPVPSGVENQADKRGSTNDQIFSEAKRRRVEITDKVLGLKSPKLFRAKRKVASQYLEASRRVKSAEESHVATQRLYDDANEALEDAKRSLEDAKTSLKTAGKTLSSAVEQKGKASDACRRFRNITAAHAAIKNRDDCRRQISEMEVKLKTFDKEADALLDQIQDGELESFFQE
ncbi:hypothetical protein FGRMN_2997 [Fusarium graminum]|nr:hypothetical protein FGRMN_2997 [Fusarium graminum]